MTLVIPRPRPVQRGDALVIGGAFCAVEAVVPGRGVALIVTEDRYTALFAPLDLVATGVRQAAQYEVCAEDVLAWCRLQVVEAAAS